MLRSKLSQDKHIKGFTLVELLIAISIVALLSTITITMFGAVQRAGRDTKRKGDLDAISNALEVNKSSAYKAISPAQFNGGVMPTEMNNYKYCIQTGITTAPATITTKDNCESGWTAIIDTPDASQDSTEWILCTELENSTTPYCKSSAQ